jgi:hypothetical protein
MFVKVCAKPWIAILAKGFQFGLHLANATLNAFKINGFLINKAFNLRFKAYFLT